MDSKGNLIGINTAIFTQTGNLPIFYFTRPLHFLVLNDCHPLKNDSILCLCYFIVKDVTENPWLPSWFLQTLFLRISSSQVNSCIDILSLTSVFGMAGTSAGVGFAIPSSTVLKIVPQLIQYGKVSSFTIYLKAIILLSSPCSCILVLCKFDQFLLCFFNKI